VYKFYKATEGQSLEEVLIGIKQINNSIPKTFALYQNYPNPFNPSTKIKFDVSSSSPEGGKENVKIVLYDVSGKEISVIVNKQLSPGTYEAEFNASGLTSGVYFYRFTAGNISETKKMILLK
jgi:hypothetical protein